MVAPGGGYEGPRDTDTHCVHPNRKRAAANIALLSAIVGRNFVEPPSLLGEKGTWEGGRVRGPPRLPCVGGHMIELVDLN